MQTSVIAKALFAAMSCLACVAAGAQTAATRNTAAIEQQPTEISAGFYSLATANGETYIATSPSGHRALLQKVMEFRDQQASAGKAGDTGTLDMFIANLSRAAASTERSDAVATTPIVRGNSGTMTEIWGDCNGPNGTGPLYVGVAANGNQATAIARNYAGGFSPPLGTTNFATGTVTRGDGSTAASQTDTESNGHEAYVSLHKDNIGCATSYSSASVTCLGHATPSISAFAHGQRTGCVIP